MSRFVSRALGATVCLLAGSIAGPPGTSAAERRASVETLSGTGTYDVSYDQLNDQIGPVLYFSQRFEWKSTRATTLRLPSRGVRRVRVPISVHVVATGGSNSYPYTCQAETTYAGTALVEAEPRSGGWRIQLTPVTQLRSAPAKCSDASVEATFHWPTGGNWLKGAMRARRPLSATLARRGTELAITRRPKPYDCTEVPGVTHQCTEALNWTGSLKLGPGRG
jgi:hypothetical protein